MWHLKSDFHTWQIFPACLGIRFRLGQASAGFLGISTSCKDKTKLQTLNDITTVAVCNNLFKPLRSLSSNENLVELMGNVTSSIQSLSFRLFSSSSVTSCLRTSRSKVKTVIKHTRDRYSRLVRASTSIQNLSAASSLFLLSFNLLDV